MAAGASSSNRKRVTENSLKVAAFENQNKVLEQVLKASRELDRANSVKVPTIMENSKVDRESQLAASGKTIELAGDDNLTKEKNVTSESTQTSGEGTPEKKRRKKNNQNFSDPLEHYWKGKRIVDYPGYDDEFDEEEPRTGWNQLDGSRQGSRGSEFDLAGNVFPPSRVTKTTQSAKASAATGRSSNKMDEKLLFGGNEHQISDNSDEDVEDREGQYGWDNMSISSSAIFKIGGKTVKVTICLVGNLRK